MRQWSKQSESFDLGDRLIHILKYFVSERSLKLILVWPFAIVYLLSVRTQVSGTQAIPSTNLHSNLNLTFEVTTLIIFGFNQPRRVWAWRSSGLFVESGRWNKPTCNSTRSSTSDSSNRGECKGAGTHRQYHLGQMRNRASSCGTWTVPSSHWSTVSFLFLRLKRVYLYFSLYHRISGTTAKSCWCPPFDVDMLWDIARK